MLKITQHINSNLDKLKTWYKFYKIIYIKILKIKVFTNDISRSKAYIISLIIIVFKMKILF